MTVKQLIDELSDCNMDAEVNIGTEKGNVFFTTTEQDFLNAQLVQGNMPDDKMYFLNGVLLEDVPITEIQEFTDGTITLCGYIENCEEEKRKYIDNLFN